jgi:hypothetical protein
MIIVGSILAVALLRTTLAVDADKPHGRVCLSFVEPGTPEKEAALRSTSTPGPGKKINVYVDASDKCSVLVVALRKDGRLANGWRPQFAEVQEEFEEVQLPKLPMAWEWIQAGEPFEFYVLFLPPGSKDVDDVKRLVTAMQSPKLEERLLTMQTNKLRELISRLTSEKERAHQVVATDPEVGGVFRGSSFPWRQFAQSVNFSEGRPGVLICSTAQPAGPKATPSAGQ